MWVPAGQRGLCEEKWWWSKGKAGNGNLGSERPRVKRKEPAVTELQPELVQLIMEMLEIAELFGVLWIFPLKFLFLSC